MIEQTIARIDSWLKEKRPEYHAQLLPGVDDSDLDAFEKRFSIKLPSDFRTLYKWKNGQSPDCSASFEENRMFSPLSEIGESKAMLDEMIDTEFEDPKWWRRGWVPFLANGGGDYLCLDVVAEDGGKVGQLVAFWHDWEDRSIEFDSISVWLEQLVSAMENGTLEST